MFSITGIMTILIRTQLKLFLSFYVSCDKCVFSHNKYYKDCFYLHRNISTNEERTAHFFR